ncbi:proline-, glutamic acid- and leucine-rich protein 1 [Impatiens glandulifera]|uniref:proline-, glutamic acid- and leucine-rich protein 1 n=1 Tax=Impatiens glandulifera TaxID=253017 RepID=UPI001FB14C97|nr:proline-, glutamic acid- and leucine-rich protein 1 [Impatiens glandulifera]
MASFHRNMHDVNLKPCLLESLTRRLKTSLKGQLDAPLIHSIINSKLETYQLLNEPSAADSVDDKLIKNWKKAVDSWIDYLLTLVSSNLPDKCWVGLLLLGVTSQRCSAERFLVSYSVWLHKIQLHIQSLEGSQIVKVAACSSLSDLFTRLGGFPKATKEGASHAIKLVEPVLKLLNGDTSEPVQEGAIYLLCAMITSFPSSINRYYDAVESAIVSKILSSKFDEQLVKELVYSLALLPKSRGDAESWSLMMLKLLYSINIQLKDAFEGIEEESRTKEAINQLVLPGKEPISSLGGLSLEISGRKLKSEGLLTNNLTSLMDCCCALLANSYPVQVPAFVVRPLLALVGRVLMVDGSIPESLLAFMTDMQQELICSQLPVLHSHALDLLSAVVRTLRSQIIPHAAHVTRLLMEYFKKCVLPALRIKVYTIAKVLMISMGAGISASIRQEIVNNALKDLDFTGREGEEGSQADTKDRSEALLRRCHKKRKTATGFCEDPAMDVHKSSASISVKIAALDALETLLTVAGALGAGSWRSTIDHLCINVATTACRDGWHLEEMNINYSGKPEATLLDFQLASLRALLTSFLSPTGVRPPFLAQGLELFNRGKQETGTKLGQFCVQALSSLEVLVHPRALPWIDFLPAGYSYDVKTNVPFSSGTQINGLANSNSQHDEIHAMWSENEDETGIPATYVGNNTNNVERPSETLSAMETETLAPVSLSNGTKPTVNELVKGTEKITTVDDTSVTQPADKIVSEIKELSGAEETSKASEDNDTKETTKVDMNKSLPVNVDDDDDSSMDSLPDIMDGDPDSD